MNELEFLRHYVANAPQIMWFLGAGTSRTAGMPTATDITWDLKLKYYCVQENQDIQKHDINNETIKRKIQSYLDSRGFPKLWSTEEYSFYFDLLFGTDRAAQQKYISDQLSAEKLSLNIGHRSFAALIEMRKIKVVFTANFDDVIEQAYSDVSGNNLMAYHLEGSYAALEALNAERFPIYAKVHGDFRYQNIKNISADLLNNDKKIQDCFLAAAGRYGLVISGYSGRDQNVMSMLYAAMGQHNAFPLGIFWTVTNTRTVATSVVEFIEAAKAQGINAHIVEVGTFDTMLSKIWRQTENRPTDLDGKVRTSTVRKVSIPLPAPGKSFPLLRTNALPIVEFPKTCAFIDIEEQLSYSELKQLLRDNRPDATVTRTDKIFGWGTEEALRGAFDPKTVKAISVYSIDDPKTALIADLRLRSFYERALFKALCDGRPVRLRSDNNNFHIIIDYQKASDVACESLKSALGYSGRPGDICGQVPRVQDVFWSESISVKLEEKNGMFWLMLKPEIWIEPSTERKNHIDFIKSRRSRRYNSAANNILNAWITLLFGSVGNQEAVEISCYKGAAYSAKFLINTRTTFSRKG